MSQSSSSSWLRDILLLTCGILILFGAFLGSRPLSVPDEGRYAEIPREMLVSGDYVTPRINQIKYFEKPPLFYWMQASSLKVFGNNEWAIRIPTALMALFGCLATYAAGRQLFDRKTGLISCGILATNLLYFSMAHVVTLDMTVSVLISISLFAFINALTYPLGWQRRVLLYVFYSGAALAMLTKGLIGIIFPGIIVGAWIVLLNEWRLLKNIYLPSGLLLFLLIATPWHVLVQLKNPEFAYFYFIDQHFLRYLTLEAKRYQPFWFWVPIIAAGLLPWTTFLAQAIYKHLPRPPFTAHKNQTFLLLWISLIFLFFSFSNSKLIPYILPIFPPLALYIGHYLSQSPVTNKGITIGYLLIPAVVLLLAIGGFGFLYYNHDHDAVINRLFLQQTFTWMISIWFIGSIVGCGLFFRRHHNSALICIGLSSIIAFSILLKAVPLIDTKSVKPLAMTVKPLLTPNSMVVTYENYFQDLPFYIQQPVKIINWEGELEFGIYHQTHKPTIMDYTTFWHAWHSDKKVFVVTDIGTYQKLLTTTHEHYYPLAKTQQNILFTNHPN